MLFFYALHQREISFKLLNPHTIQNVLCYELNLSIQSTSLESQFAFTPIKTPFWGGFCDPKTSDIYLFHPYVNHCSIIEKNGKKVPAEGEYTINSIYRDLGYKSYILSDPTGHVKHIGWDYHITVDYWSSYIIFIIKMIFIFEMI